MNMIDRSMSNRKVRGALQVVVNDGVGEVVVGGWKGLGTDPAPDHTVLSIQIGSCADIAVLHLSSVIQ